MQPEAFRAQFPVCSHLTYLNAGTDGPLPAAAVQVAHEELDSALADGRWLPHMIRRFTLHAELRERYATVLGASAADVALTTSTSEGLGSVLLGLGLGPGDEIVSSETEHLGLIGPLLAARQRGVRLKLAPLDRIASAVSGSTTVVACSHVGWMTGDLADPALAEVDVPVVFDGAQAAGAIPLDVKALGCAAYAASGQKWMCGADGTGMLYLSPEFRERVAAVSPGHESFAEPARGIESPLHSDARRYDTQAISREAVGLSEKSAGVLEDAGWDWVHTRARDLAARLADELTERGRTVAARGATTLVSLEDDDPAGLSKRLNADGFIVRNVPNTPYVRFSVGAWNNEDDLERLLAAL